MQGMPGMPRRPRFPNDSVVNLIAITVRLSRALSFSDSQEVGTKVRACLEIVAQHRPQ